MLFSAIVSVTKAWGAKDTYTVDVSDAGSGADILQVHK